MLSNEYDGERRTVVFQIDPYTNTETTSEFKAHATQAEIARALCDNDGLGDFHVVSIVEIWIKDGKCNIVTEDVAKLIPAISEEAYRDGWRIRSCARDLMERFGINDPANGDLNLNAWAEKTQRGFDEARHRRAMDDLEHVRHGRAA